MSQLAATLAGNPRPVFASRSAELTWAAAAAAVAAESRFAPLSTSWQIDR